MLTVYAIAYLIFIFSQLILLASESQPCFVGEDPSDKLVAVIPGSGDKARATCDADVTPLGAAFPTRDVVCPSYRSHLLIKCIYTQ